MLSTGPPLVSISVLLGALFRLNFFVADFSFLSAVSNTYNTSDSAM